MPRCLVYPAAPSARAYPGHIAAGRCATGMTLEKVANFKVSHGKCDTWIWLFTSNKACMRSLRPILQAWRCPSGYDTSGLTRFHVLKKIWQGLLHNTQDSYYTSELTGLKQWSRTTSGVIMGSLEGLHHPLFYIMKSFQIFTRIPNRENLNSFRSKLYNLCQLRRSSS